MDERHGWRPVSERWARFVCVLLLLVSVGCSGAQDGPLDPESPEARAAAFETRLPEIVAGQSQDARWDKALDAVKGTVHRGQLISDAYQGAGHKSIFARAGALTPAGARLKKALTRSRFEGLKPDDYHVAAIDAALASLTERADALVTHAAARPALSEAQTGALEELAEAHPPGESVEGLMWTKLQSEAEGTPLGAWIDSYRGLLAGVAEETLQVELLLADGALRYARDMRHFNLEDVPEAARENKAEIIDQRQSIFATQLVEVGQDPSPEGAIERLLEALRPYNDHYLPLVIAAERYQAIVDAGGWPTAMPRIPAPKNPKDAFRYKANYRRYPAGVVEKVKARLAGERLYEGPIDNKWDKALTEAVRRYRRNNLMRDKAWIDYEMTRSMMVPAEFRLGQIKLNLQRMRESRVGAVGDYYVHVNLPEYKAEVWDGGERTAAFKVIVGSRKKTRERSERGWVFQDATPLISAKMERVVLNPSWSVPTRIRAEIERKAAKNPGFFKKYGFETVKMVRGSIIRQRPGPDNALGVAKFLFPNEHDVYMHDTPDRGLFWHDVRAFSHGCMRVENPLDFAQVLLSRQDPSWTMRKLKRRVSNGMEAGIELKDGPEVHIEYITVRVDPNTGDVRFLWDIYHHDIHALRRLEGLELAVNLHYP